MRLKANIRTLLHTLAFLFLLQSNSYSQTNDSVFVAATIYPNPFYSTLTIKHNKTIEDLEEVAIYDAIGNIVFSFSREDYEQDQMIWEGVNHNGSTVNAGTYICHIRSRKKTESFLIQKQ